MSLCWNAVLREYEGPIAAQRPCARANGTIKHRGQGWKKHMRPKKRHSDNIVFSAIIITHILAFVACRLDWFVALRRKLMEMYFTVFVCPWLPSNTEGKADWKPFTAHAHWFLSCLFWFSVHIVVQEDFDAAQSRRQEKTKVCLNVTVLSFYILLLNPSDFIESFSTKAR